MGVGLLLLCTIVQGIRHLRSTSPEKEKNPTVVEEPNNNIKALSNALAEEIDQYNKEPTSSTDTGKDKDRTTSESETEEEEGDKLEKQIVSTVLVDNVLIVRNESSEKNTVLRECLEKSLSDPKMDHLMPLLAEAHEALEQSPNSIARFNVMYVITANQIFSLEK